MTRLEGAYGAIEIGQRKEAEGDSRRALTAYEAGITDLMHLAFAECLTVDEVKIWISSHPFELAATRYVALTAAHLKLPEVERTRYPLDGNYLPIAFSHFFAILGQIERSRFFAQIGANIARPSTSFWAEYGLTLWSLIEGHYYEPSFGKLKQEERYWACYISLMQSLIKHTDVTDAINKVDSHFSKRNSDLRLHTDAYMVDGTGEFPLRFDFRKAGIMATFESVRG